MKTFNKQERAYAYIRKKIESGEFGPGRRLIIDSLARKLAMSQVPIREAIRRLEAAGWIVYHPNSGPVVAHMTRESWEAGMEVLAVAEGYATALAASHMTAAAIATLRKINKAMADSLKNLDLLAFSRDNREFHACIYENCPNPFLVEQLITTQAHLDAIQGTVFTRVPERGRISVEEHADIIRAIEKKAPFDEIERVAREHKMNTVRAARQHLDRQLAEAHPAGTP